MRENMHTITAISQSQVVWPFAQSDDLLVTWPIGCLRVASPPPAAMDGATLLYSFVPVDADMFTGREVRPPPVRGSPVT